MVDNDEILKFEPKYADLIPIRDLTDTRLLEIDGVFLAGASLQTFADPDVKIYDYDIFFTDKEVLPEAQAVLKANGFTVGVDSFFISNPKMFTYYKDGVKVQLIFKDTYDTPQACIETFDFKCTMFAYDGKYMWSTIQAGIDVCTREININVLEFPRGTMERLEKYVNIKGYTIAEEVLEEIDEAVVNDEGESYFYEGDERRVFHNRTVRIARVNQVARRWYENR